MEKREKEQQDNATQNQQQVKKELNIRSGEGNRQDTADGEDSMAEQQKKEAMTERD